MDNVLNLDFRYVMPEDTESRVYVEITTGEYSRTIFKYGDVKLDNKPDDSVSLSFIFEIIETPLDKKVLEKDPAFRNKLGDILVSILEMKLNNEAGDINNDETITDDIEELNI